MQRALNSLDQENRNVNAIITGLPESNMEVASLDNNGDTLVLYNDMDKIQMIYRLMGCNHLENDKFSRIIISRIGEARESYNRAVKIKFECKKDRDDFIKNSSKLKDISPT